MIPIRITVSQSIDMKRPERFKDAIEATIGYAANKIMLESKAHCPVKTGRLQNSIKISDIFGGKAVGPDTPYDIYVEYGHRTISGGYVPPNPYMRTGIDTSAKAISNFLHRAVRRTFD